MNDLKKQVQDQVDEIAKIITNSEYERDDEDSDYEFCCAEEFLQDVLDINYTVDSGLSYKSASVLVASGWADIYINTAEKCVEGHWGGDVVKSHFDDNLGIDEYLENVYECLRG